LKNGLYLLNKLTDKIANTYKAELGDYSRASPKRYDFGGLLSDGPETTGDEEESDSADELNERDSSLENDTTSQKSSDDPLGADIMRNKEVVDQPTVQELVESHLDKLVLSMSNQVDINALAQMRSRFCSRIQTLQMTVTKDNKRVEATFGPYEVAEITNFFFSDMLGVKALKRLSDLVHYYSETSDTPFDKHVSSRARWLAEDSKTPEMLRAYYSHLSRATEHDDEHRVFKHLQQVLRHLDLLKEHNRLKLLAQEKNPDLVEVLKQAGQTTRRGRTLVSCLLDFLSGSLRTSKTALSNIVQEYSGIEKLVDLFGQGLILLLPPGSGRR
jgi:hypothetical protein